MVSCSSENSSSRGPIWTSKPSVPSCWHVRLTYPALRTDGTALVLADGFSVPLVAVLGYAGPAIDPQLPAD